jgi:NADPH:quinone reductase-like Zn-dependent oxidoreductase
MKAILFTKYGSPDAIELKDVEKPIPQDHQLLIKVYAASINALDRHALNSKPALMRIMSGNGLFKPKDPRLGADIAGRVEAVGASVTQFRPGDEVFGVCAGGGFAEYACAREDAVVLKPNILTFEAAAAVPVAALTALQGLRDKGRIQPGQKVLIDGASGGVGTFAVQIAKSFGAEVTATCSTKNLEMARSIGAGHVIDYTREDFTRNGQRYDLILAVNGYHPILAYKRALSPKGIHVLAGGPTAHLFQAILQTLLLGPLLSKAEGQKMGFMGIAKIAQKDLEYMKELLEAGKVIPVIDRAYPLSETAEAFRYLEKEHAQGKVVITVEQNNK